MTWAPLRDVGLPGRMSDNECQPMLNVHSHASSVVVPALTLLQHDSICLYTHAGRSASALGSALPVPLKNTQMALYFVTMRLRINSTSITTMPTIEKSSITKENRLRWSMLVLTTARSAAAFAVFSSLSRLYIAMFVNLTIRKKESKSNHLYGQVLHAHSVGYTASYFFVVGNMVASKSFSVSSTPPGSTFSSNSSSSSSSSSSLSPSLSLSDSSTLSLWLSSS